MVEKIKQIKSDIEATKKRRRANKIEAYELGMELLFKTKSNFDILKSTLGETGTQFMPMADALATETMQCGIDYFKAMKDNSGFSGANSLEILNSAKSITVNPQITARIKDNIEGINDWVKKQELYDSQHNIYDFNKVLLKTAFSFMTCDGHIAPNEVAYIRDLAEKEEAFGDINIDMELDFLVEVINTMGMGFLKDYFKVLKNANLTQDQELHLIDLAVNTLYADGKVDYNEVKFFRIFRSIMTVSDDQIRKKCPSLSEDFLESDIFSHAYLGQLFDKYFDEIDLPVFDKVTDMKKMSYVDPEKYAKN